MKQELSKKAKLSIFKAVFVLILTYGNESWVMTERVRPQVQASEMRFLQRIEGVTLFNKVGSSEIQKFLNIDVLLPELKDLSLDDLAMEAECRKKDSPNKLSGPKQRIVDQLDDLKLDGPITLRILEKIA